MNSMLNIEYNKPLEFLDALSFGGQMLVLGMGAVFAVLGIIWALLVIFKMVFTKVGTSEKSPQPQQEAVAATTPIYNTADSEIVAVIAAAIAMAEAESTDNMKFRVVSFKRK